MKEAVVPGRPSTSAEKSPESPSHGSVGATGSGGKCGAGAEMFRVGEKHVEAGELYQLGQTGNPQDEMYQQEPIHLGKENSKCENCGKEAHFMCSACKASHYCSSQCQVNSICSQCQVNSSFQCQVNTMFPVSGKQ